VKAMIKEDFYGGELVERFDQLSRKKTKNVEKTIIDKLKNN